MSMDARGWARLSQLFDHAVDLPPEARRAYAERECGDDPELLQRLLDMLDADEDVDARTMDQSVSHLLRSTDAREDPEELREDHLLGHWRLGKCLGRGGMGTVHAAIRDDDSGQRAALKVLQRRWDGSEQARRFLQERRILARLTHPNIPQLVDHGLDDEGRPWFAMEFVDGISITKWADQQRLDLRQRIDLFRQVCAAVQHAHQQFVVHRDLKPDNILVDTEGHPKVLDFGVAKRMDSHLEDATRTGAFAGFTPEYAAPEQVANGSISAATDVYALGVLLYHLLCGRLPYQVDADNLRAATEAITTRTPERLDKALLSGTAEEVADRLRARDTSAEAFRRFSRGDLSRILQTAMAKEPQRRYTSVDAFSNDLKRFLQHRPVSVSGDTLGYRSRMFIARNRWAVAMGLLAAVALIGGMIGMAWQLQETRAQRDAATAESDRNSALVEYFNLMFGTVGSSNVTARQMLESSSGQLIDRYRDRPATGIAVALNAADLSLRIGNPQAAASLYRRILDWPGIDKFADARSAAQLGLADALQQQGQHDQALPLLQQAEAQWQQSPTRYARELSQAGVVRARIQRAQGDPKAAVTTIRAALARRSDSVGTVPDRMHASIAGDLAANLIAIGDWPGARQAAQQAWDEFGKLGMQSSSDALAAMNNLAVVATMTNDFPAAERAMRIVLEARKSYPESTETAAVLGNLGATIARQKRYAEAAPYLTQALEMATRTSGPASAPAMTFRPGLADVLAQAGDLAKAQALIEEQLQLAAQHYAKQPLYAAMGLRARAQLRYQQGNLAAARSDAEQAETGLRAAGPAAARLLESLQALQAKLKTGEAPAAR